MDVVQRIGSNLVTAIVIHYIAGRYIFLLLCLVMMLKCKLWFTLLLLETFAQKFEVFVPIHQILNNTYYEFLNFPILLVRYEPGTGLPDYSDDDYPFEDDPSQEYGDPFYDEL